MFILSTVYLRIFIRPVSLLLDICHSLTHDVMLSFVHHISIALFVDRFGRSLLTYDFMLSFVDHISVVFGPIWTFFTVLSTRIGNFKPHSYILPGIVFNFINTLEA